MQQAFHRLLAEHDGRIRRLVGKLLQPLVQARVHAIFSLAVAAGPRPPACFMPGPSQPCGKSYECRKQSRAVVGVTCICSESWSIPSTTHTHNARVHIFNTHACTHAQHICTHTRTRSYACTHAQNACTYMHTHMNMHMHTVTHTQNAHNDERYFLMFSRVEHTHTLIHTPTLIIAHAPSIPGRQLGFSPPSISNESEMHPW